MNAINSRIADISVSGCQHLSKQCRSAVIFVSASVILALNFPEPGPAVPNVISMATIAILISQFMRKRRCQATTILVNDYHEIDPPLLQLPQFDQSYRHRNSDSAMGG
jgi:hypothetical protein